MVYKFLLLAALIRFLIMTEKPLLCSILYTLSALIINLVFGVPFSVLLLPILLTFALSTLYFWLLQRFNESGIIWWIILIVGFFIGLV